MIIVLRQGVKFRNGQHLPPWTYGGVIVWRHGPNFPLGAFFSAALGVIFQPG